MTDIRWSYDPRTNELDVWDSLDGRIGHYQRYGDDGYFFCAQGRIQEKAKTIYHDRPMIEPGHPLATPDTLDSDEVRILGRKALDEFENGKYADLPWF